MEIVSRIRRALSRTEDTIVVQNTGDAVELDGGHAVSGFKGRLPRGRSIVVQNTGDAVADGNGNAVSGIDYS